MLIQTSALRRTIMLAVSSSCFVSAPAIAATLQAGVNISGLEMNPGTLPGIANVDFAVPTSAELAYYHGKGINLARLPVLWERLQPALLSNQPALNTAYLHLLTTVIRQANALGMHIILDVHNYGQYDGNKLGGGTLTNAQYAEFWQSLATILAPAHIAGYDLMNEPEGMPSATAWPRAAQAAVTGIRQVDTATPIYVEGDDWATASEWQNVNGNLNIKDPANKIVYQAHVYGDRDSSGTHFIWSQEVNYGVTVNTIAERIQPFAAWCAGHQFTCMIGEVGVGNDSPDWNTELANGLAAASEAGFTAFTYWAGGLWWGSYPLSIEPRPDGEQARQMTVVAPYGD